MKKYSVPHLNLSEFKISEDIAAGLNEWLSSNQLTDAGITTYIVNS